MGIGSPLAIGYWPCIPGIPVACVGGTRPLWTAIEQKTHRKKDDNVS